MDDTNGTGCNMIRDVEISDIEMASALAAGTTAILLKEDRAFVVLVEDVILDGVALSVEKMFCP